MAFEAAPSTPGYAYPEGVTVEFVSFLKTVDAPEERPMEVLCSVAMAFIANGISSKLEMVGVERSDLALSMLRVSLHVHVSISHLLGQADCNFPQGPRL